VAGVAVVQGMAAVAADPGVGGVGELSSLRFAAVARRLSELWRRRGLEAPAFRSPPRSPGVRRAIRRESDGSATVSVALRGRPAVAVVADMIDGIVVAAGLGGVEAGRARDELWMAAMEALSSAGGAVGPVARSAA
jgi:hypothetical protein